MKKTISLLLCLLLVCSACTPEGTQTENDPSISVSAEEVALAILDACGRTPELERTDEQLDESALSAYLTNYYRLEEGSWTDCVIYRAGGAEAFEIAVLEFGSQVDMEAVTNGLDQYLMDRQGDFTGYAPEQAKIVEQSLSACTHSNGSADKQFAALLICPDAFAARNAFLACFGEAAQPSPSASEPSSSPDSQSSASNGGNAVSYPGRVDYTQPGIDDMTVYDTSAIRSAWSSRDPSGLSQYDRTIYDHCQAILEKIFPDGYDTLPDYEKEVVVYQWITANVVYDYDHYNPLVQIDQASYTPYGPLVNGKGVCLGFATTFQLFMDLCGVECITVVGAAFQSKEDHAWNMVRLNGNWYCADPTWDSERIWSYFNVTSDYMAESDHQWDYSAIPEATSTDGGNP